MYDLLLKNGFLVDPKNKIEGNFDIAIQDGQICRVDQQICEKSKRILDLTDKVVVPGIIDMHTHVRTTLGHPHAQRMLALAGVCTTLDMGGPLDNILDTVSSAGSGINVAILEAVTKDSLISGTASREERKAFIEQTLDKGGIGIKLLGGHYPMKNSLCADYIQLCSSMKAWVAWHVGNKIHGSNIDGFKDAIEAAQGNFLHIAHVNSYCRGQVSNELTESLEAICQLEKNTNIFSESYLSPLNSTIIACRDGKPVSRVACTCLKSLGYEATYEGMKKAILDGKLGVLADNGTLGYLLKGEEGVASWEAVGTVTNGSFSINPATSRFLLATAKRKDGSFVVDCFSTDGGACPRNVIVENGLLLVKFGALSLKEFVVKSSLNGANALGLPKKGHLAVGADADITVIDVKAEKAFSTIVGGNVIMESGHLCGKGTRFICDERGANYLKRKGLELYLKEPLSIDRIMDRFSLKAKKLSKSFSF